MSTITIQSVNIWGTLVHLDQQMGTYFPILLLPGLGLLLRGWKFHKLFLFTSGALVSTLTLHELSRNLNPDLSLTLSLVGGLLFGALALPFLYGYIFLTGGLFAWGVLNLASLATHSHSYPISEPTSLLVLLLGGLLALTNHRIAIVFITSFLGSALTLLGILSILHALSPSHVTQATQYAQHHGILLAYAFGFLTCLGTVLQPTPIDLPPE
ncbi:MAG: DUF4203 domain-containing protein [Planctomycetota bacterium]|jgi:hypothetical protein|nr:DUF4203 domain-containing protein [Planctomycetota bacterium]